VYIDMKYARYIPSRACVNRCLFSAGLRICRIERKRNGFDGQNQEILSMRLKVSSSTENLNLWAMVDVNEGREFVCVCVCVSCLCLRNIHIYI
jgi:hypothetical protein